MKPGYWLNSLCALGWHNLLYSKYSRRVGRKKVIEALMNVALRICWGFSFGNPFPPPLNSIVSFLVFFVFATIKKGLISGEISIQTLCLEGREKLRLLWL